MNNTVKNLISYFFNNAILYFETDKGSITSKLNKVEPSKIIESIVNDSIHSVVLSYGEYNFDLTNSITVFGNKLKKEIKRSMSVR